MSHLDEGALHAYLDGGLDAYPDEEAERIREHLDACGACAARLREEARVRDEASAVLAGAVPDVAMPPLEELRARARVRSARTSASGRLSRMGWAASVVLALGTGWTLRGMRPPTGAPVALPEAEAPAEKQIVPQRRSRDAAPAARVDAPEAGVGEEGRASQARSQPAAIAPPAPPASREASDEAALTDARGSAAAGSGAVEPVVAADVLRRAMAPAPAVRAPIEPALLRAEERDARAALAGLVAPAAARDAVPDAAPEAAPSLAGAGGPARLSEPMGTESVGPSLLVPGLELLGMTRLERGAPTGTVRVEQLLESGDTLWIVHVPSGADPSDLSLPVVPGVGEVAGPLGSGWAVLRGRVAEAELRALLERLRQGG